MSKQGASDTKKTSKFFFPTILVIVFLVWLAWPFILTYGNSWVSSYIDDTARLGQLGDLFGGLNALFTAAAFAAVWWTGQMQRDDLEIQQRELADTRSVLAQQTFEATFFQMLGMLREIGNSAFVIDISDERKPGIERSGASAWKVFSRLIVHNAMWGIEHHKVEHNDAEAIRAAIAEIYENDLYPKFEPWLGPYFRALYNLFKLIESQRGLEDEQRVMYGNIVRSQLSGDVLSVLAVNGCSDALAKGMKTYISEYRLLKHLPDSDLKPYLRKVYPPEAFQDRPMSAKDIKKAFDYKTLGNQAKERIGYR